MGGKGGGGGGGNWQDVYMTSPTTGGVMTRDGHAITKAEYAAKYYDIDHPAAPAPVQDTPIKPAAPAPAAPEPAGPAAPEPTPDPLGPPIDAGGGVDQPGTGDQLGGAVVNPPKYWVGGIDSYKKKNTSDAGGTSGAITTTQT